MEMNGYWLPCDIQAQLINAETPFSGLSFRGGRECPSGTPGSVHARWLKLNTEEWCKLIAMLKSNRQRVPRGEAYWQRLQSALQNVADQLNNPQDALSQKAIGALPVYSGFSEEMIAFTMQALELINLSDLPRSLKTQPTWRAARQWQALSGLPGLLRFYPQNLSDKLQAFLPGSHKRSLFTPAQPPALITGYAAGNVPGTALLMCLLAQAAARHDSPPPALIIKNSRREPIFSAMALSALEEADPDLFASTAVLV